MRIIKSHHIIGHPNYQITTNGDIIDIRDNTIKSFSINPDGYRITSLNSKGYRLGRLVGLHFIPNPDNLSEIDHIDRNRINDDINNLRWTTRSGNNKNRRKYKLSKETSNKMRIYHIGRKRKRILCNICGKSISITQINKHQKGKKCKQN